MKKFIIACFFSFIAAISFSQNLVPNTNASSIKFAIKNSIFTVTGSFKGLQGSIQFDEKNPAQALFNVSVDANSINTGIDSRDSHLRKEEYFDVKKFPTLNFISTKVSATNKAGTFIITGKLTIKGTSKEVSFPFSVTEKNNGYLLAGEFKINRRDFKVGGSSFILADNLTVSLSVLAEKK